MVLRVEIMKERRGGGIRIGFVKKRIGFVKKQCFQL
jgi:hypothetical protein